MVCWARLGSFFPKTWQSQELDPCRASTACCHTNIKVHPVKCSEPKDEVAVEHGSKEKRNRAAH